MYDGKMRLFDPDTFRICKGTMNSLCTLQWHIATDAREPFGKLCVLGVRDRGGRSKRIAYTQLKSQN